MRSRTVALEAFDELVDVHQTLDALRAEHVDLVDHGLHGRDEGIQRLRSERVIAVAKHREDLEERRRHGRVLLAQHQEAGSEVVGKGLLLAAGLFLADHGRRANEPDNIPYRGLVLVEPRADGARVGVRVKF